MASQSGTGDADETAATGPSRTRLIIRRIVLGLAVVAIAGFAVWVVYGVGVDTVVEKIQELPPVLVVTLVFLLPALEASAFVGVIFPGEIAVLVGGVAAANGRVSLAAVLVAACLGAVIGDQIGYVIGRSWGAQVLRKIPDRLLDDERLERTQWFVNRAGAKGVIVGRWTAALRALVPGLAGMSRMHYPKFLAANVVGGVAWAVLCGVLGYLAGSHFHTVERALTNTSSIILVLLIAAALANHFLRRRRSGDRPSLEERLEKRIQERIVGADEENDEAEPATPRRG